jgi:hypothetical protein
MTTVRIIPEPGELKKIAKELFALADDPRDVEYVSWPQASFKVSEELGARFVASRETAPVEDAPVEPVKRKPGRPKKVQEED